MKCPRCGVLNPAYIDLCRKCATSLHIPAGSPADSTQTYESPIEELKIGQILTGKYRILDSLGKGGMGIVYLGEQEKPIRRKVAIKIIKPGMDTKEVIARFESERQALAIMNHPNIAQVYDSGETEKGHSYFVMEYVPGVSITKHCDKYGMTLQERLLLFKSVCDAVQHAHYRGIIHRDIKPGNILVVFQDNKHVPKIIDFGIAKALSGTPLTDKTLYTSHGVAIGTPAYMSPEQAELSGYDLDTRTDVYSLGVLLYELLVGVPPFDNRDLFRAGFLEILRIIREVEPPKPSARFKSLGDTTTEIAKKRSTQSNDVARQLSSDLECIILKAIEKDKRRRYGSPSEFAADIERHLANRPILARQPSALYQLRKFVQRSPTAVVGFSVFIIVIGLIGALLRTRSAATNARMKAEQYEVSTILASLDNWDNFEPLKRKRAQELIDNLSSRLLNGKADKQECFDFARAMMKVEIAGRSIQAAGNTNLAINIGPNGAKAEGLGIAVKPRLEINGTSIDCEKRVIYMEFSESIGTMASPIRQAIAEGDNYVLGGVLEARLFRCVPPIGIGWNSGIMEIGDVLKMPNIISFLSDTMLLPVQEYSFMALDKVPDSYPIKIHNEKEGEQFLSGLKVGPLVVNHNPQNRSRVEISLDLEFAVRPKIPAALEVTINGESFSNRQLRAGVLIDSTNEDFVRLEENSSFYYYGNPDGSLRYVITFTQTEGSYGNLAKLTERKSCFVNIESSREVALSHFTVEKYLDLHKNIRIPVKINKN